jgi:hypothetical protein
VTCFTGQLLRAPRISQVNWSHGCSTPWPFVLVAAWLSRTNCVGCGMIARARASHGFSSFLHAKPHLTTHDIFVAADAGRPWQWKYRTAIQALNIAHQFNLPSTRMDRLRWRDIERWLVDRACPCQRRIPTLFMIRNPQGYHRIRRS